MLGLLYPICGRVRVYLLCCVPQGLVWLFPFDSMSVLAPVPSVFDSAFVYALIVGNTDMNTAHRTEPMRQTIVRLILTDWLE